MPTAMLKTLRGTNTALMGPYSVSHSSPSGPAVGPAFAWCFTRTGVFALDNAKKYCLGSVM